MELSWRTVKIKAMDSQIVKGHKSLLVLKVDIDKTFIKCVGMLVVSKTGFCLTITSS